MNTAAKNRLTSIGITILIVLILNIVGSFF
ncbi:MAG: hypothetical protein RLZZ44_1308, partial [Bacteroidota bacterium]